MKCRYCGVEDYKLKKDVCPTCANKLPAAKRFVAECQRFKKRIGYVEGREVQTDDR